MEIREKRTIQSEITVGHECDVCKKRVMQNNTLPKGWIDFNVSHDEWGSDSNESFECYDVCSFECYIKRLEFCVAEMKEYSRTAIIDNKPHDFITDMLSKIKA